jgi:hypothetical protein
LERDIDLRLFLNEANTSPETSLLRLLIANTTGSKYRPIEKTIRSLGLKLAIEEDLLFARLTVNGTKK